MKVHENVEGYRERTKAEIGAIQNEGLSQQKSIRDFQICRRVGRYPAVGRKEARSSREFSPH